MHGLTNPMLKLQDPSSLGAAKGMLFGMRLVFFWFLSALRRAETLLLHPVQIFAVEAGVWLKMGGSVWQGRFGIMCRASCSIHFQFMILYFPFKFLSFSSVYAIPINIPFEFVLAI